MQHAGVEENTQRSAAVAHDKHRGGGKQGEEEKSEQKTSTVFFCYLLLNASRSLWTLWLCRVLTPRTSISVPLFSSTFALPCSLSVFWRKNHEARAPSVVICVCDEFGGSHSARARCKGRARVSHAQKALSQLDIHPYISIFYIAMATCLLAKLLHRAVPYAGAAALGLFRARPAVRTPLSGFCIGPSASHQQSKFHSSSPARKRDPYEVGCPRFSSAFGWRRAHPSPTGARSFAFSFGD